MIISRLYRNALISIIISTIATILGMLVDGIVIGRFFGTDSMAAYGLVSPLFSIISAFSGVLAAGAQVCCANHLGAGRADRARQVFSVCMAAAVTVALAATLIAYFFCEPLCVTLGVKGSAAYLMPLAKGYLYGIAPGILPVLLLFILASLLRLDGASGRVVMAVAVMTVVDIAGDLLVALVFHAGMTGMGISTAVSYFAGLAVLLIHFRKPDRIFRLELKDINIADLAGIFSIGAPNAVGSFSTMIRTAILNIIMVSAAGSAAVAALSIRNTMHTLLGSIMLGIGMTTTMIAGMVYGEEDRTSAKNLMKVSVRYAVLIGTILAVLTYIGSPLLVLMFSDGGVNSEEMTELAARAMRIYVFGIPVYGINMVVVGYLQGIGRLKLSNLVSLLDNLIFVVLTAVILAPVIKEDGVWLSFPLGEALTLLSVCLIAGIIIRKIPSKTEDFLFLPDDFGVKPEDIFERNFTEVDEVIHSTDEVIEFIKARGAARREQMMIPLFIEEMVVNVIEHGFNMDSRKHLVEVRVFRKDGWVIRIRDNCPAFDPVRRLKMYSTDDPAANVGIKMVCGMAKDVEYLYAMDLNNLIIRV